MEEEIDLRRYIVVLIKYWYWIAGLTLVAAAAAFIISFWLPPVYEAKALVAITYPRLLFQFTPDIRTQNVLPDYQTFPLIATSDELLNQLAQTLADKGVSLAANRPLTLESLRPILSASSAAGSSLVELKVKLNDPQKASTIANLWAELFTAQANSAYGQSEQEKARFVSELEQIRGELENIEARLAEIGAETGQGLLIERAELNNPSISTNINTNQNMYASFGILGAELEAKAQLLVANKSRKDKLELLMTQATALQSAVEQNNLDETTAATNLLVELAQLTSFDNPVDLTLEINPAPNASPKINDILAILESNLAAVEGVITKTSQELDELQAEMAAQRQTFNDLARQHELKQVLYVSLARKVAENEIGEGETDPVRLVSTASPPQVPVSPNQVLNTIVAGALGLLLGIFGVFAVEWWRAGETLPVEERQLGEQKKPDPHEMARGYYGGASQAPSTVDDLPGQV